MTTQTLSVTRTSARLPLWWLVAGVAGFVGGMAIKTAIEILAAVGGFTPVLESISPAMFGALLGALLGSCTGLAQWLVLRRYIAGLGAWLPATTGAYIVFWLLHNAEAFGFAHTPWGLVGQGFGHGAIVGAMTGAAQWLVLRGRVPHAGRWVAISLVSWSAAGAIMHFVLDVLLASSGNYGPFDILIASALAALFSGFGLERLLSSLPAAAPAA